MDEVGNLIDNMMSELNYDIDELKKDLKDVTLEFLRIINWYKIRSYII